MAWAKGKEARLDAQRMRENSVMVCYTRDLHSALGSNKLKKHSQFPGIK